jgi:hypothetical protein
MREVTFATPILSFAPTSSGTAVKSMILLRTLGATRWGPPQSRLMIEITTDVSRSQVPVVVPGAAAVVVAAAAAATAEASGTIELVVVVARTR